MTRKHLFLMAIGCAVPMIALATVFLFRIQINTVFLIGLFLLCPAMHMLMMRGHTGHSTHAPEPRDSQVLSDIANNQQTATSRE